MIREFVVSDFESYRECLDSVAQERLYLALEKAPPMEQCRSFITTLISKGGPMFVAVDGLQVVGWCDITPDAVELGRLPGTLGMGVRASHRNCGLGGQLLAATLAKAKAQGMKEVQLTVRTSNEVAIRLYRRFQFQDVEKLEGYLEMGGMRHDCLRMKLCLR